VRQRTDGSRGGGHRGEVEDQYGGACMNALTTFLVLGCGGWRRWSASLPLALASHRLREAELIRHAIAS